ncbi:phage tail tape measure protein [Arthrobacter sp. YC-RL1]|nr:phage tail tape measure protein [Arthrobacter sp. YC-RL1]
MTDAAKETEKLAKSADEAGDSAKRRMADIEKVAAADQRAAKSAGLLYNAQGQLTDANGKVLSSTQAAAHNLEAFSDAAYLAGFESETAAAKSAAAWETVSNVMMGAGTGIVAGVGMAVKKYADFDKSMSAVQAATHETSGNMLQLREAAISAGADTAFSAEEAAGAIEELAKAGVSTESILGGGLNGALSLAAAGNLGVGEAAEIAASAMTQFKLSGDQIPHLADLLAAGAGKAQGSVHDLGEALNQAGLVASGTGLSVEETTGTLAAFASAGLTGSDAGTSFKTMLQKLQAPSKESAKLMDELGINMYDANGEFAGMDALAGQLASSLSTKSAAERDAAMATIFGSDAVRAANVLYQQGAEGIQEWTDKVNDAGYAAETAAIMQDNLAGDVEKLGGAFDTVFIKSGSGANDALRELVQGAESVVDAIGRIPGPVLSTVTSIAGVAGATALAVGGFTKLAPAVVDTWSAFKDLGAEGSRMPGKLGKVTKAVGILGAAFAALSTAATITSEIRSNLDKPVKASEIINALSEITDKGESSAAALDAVFKNTVVTGGGSGIGGAPTAVNDLASAMDRLYNPSGFDNFNDFLGTIFGPGVESGSEVVRQNIGELDSALKTLAQSGAYEQAAAGFTMMHDSALQSGASIQEIKGQAPEYLNSLRDVASAAGVVVGEQELLNWALSGTAPEAVQAAQAAKETADALAEVGVSASGAVDSMADFLDLLFQTGMITMNSRDAAAAYEEQLDSVQEAAEEIAEGKLGKALNKAKDDFDLSTEAGRLANQEFQALAKGGMDEVRAMSEEGLGQDQLQEKLSTTYKDLVKSGEAFGLSKSAAQDLAREVLGVPDGVSIESWMSEVAKTTAEETTKSIAEIPGYTEVTVAVTEDGTTGEVQSKINGVTGKTEYVFVTEDGTTQVVQEAIVSIDGVTRKVWVTDDGTVVGTQADINGIKGKNATVTVGASGIDTVERQLNWVARPRASSISIKQSITKEITSIDNGTITGQFGKKKAGGRLPQHADGGRLPRTGLGTDKILGIASDGTPLSWVDDLEWVINRRSSDKHDELLGMINRDDPRVDMMKQLVGLKSGGRVGEAERKVDRLQRQYSRMSGDKKSRARKLDLKDELDAAKKELKAVKASTKASEKVAKEAKKKAEEARKAERERQGRLSEARFDLRRDLKRGDITDSFTSGSGMSVVDRLFEQSKNKDLSKGKRSALRSTAYGMESQLLKLEKQSKKLETQLDKATAARDRLLEASKSVASGLRGEYSLGGVLSNLLSGEQKGPLSAGSFVKSAQGKAAQFKRFGKMLERLRKKGYSEAIIREIADLGTVEGTQVGNALLSATGKERQQLNDAYKSMDYWSGQAGDEVTKSMYRGGIDAAEGLVAGLESKQKGVEDAFYKLGKSAEKAFRRSLDMHSPSRTLAVSGRDALDGILVGHDDRRQAVIDAYAGLGHDVAAAYQPNLALAVPPSYEVSQYAQAQAAPASVSPEAIAQAVRDGMAGWQPMVNIDGRKFYGVMSQVAQNVGNRR